MNRLCGVWKGAWLNDLDLAFDINVQYNKIYIFTYTQVQVVINMLTN